MRSSRALPGLVLSALLLGAALLTAGPTDALEHFRLKTSTPEDGAEVTSVETVHLWFTQVPQDGATTVRVVGADGELVAAKQLEQDEEDGTYFRLPLEAAPAAGSYTVRWRSMAADGHVVRGDFSFTVAAEAR